LISFFREMVSSSYSLRREAQKLLSVEAPQARTNRLVLDLEMKVFFSISASVTFSLIKVLLSRKQEARI
jgi:hypothetical protein